MRIIKNMSQNQKDIALNSQLFYFNSVKDAQIKVAAAEDALSFLQGADVHTTPMRNIVGWYVKAFTFTDKFLRDANITTRNTIADLRDAGAR